MRLLEKIARALHEREIPYRVIGGHAVSLYTASKRAEDAEDIDITLGITLRRLCEVQALAAQIGLEPLLVTETFTQDTLVFPCRDRATGTRVDFLFAPADYDHRTLRRVPVELGETEVCFAAPEDVIIQKVVAGRPQDFKDAQAILRQRPDLDLSYIRRCLAELEAVFAGPYSERFERALESSRGSMMTKLSL